MSSKPVHIWLFAVVLLLSSCSGSVPSTGDSVPVDSLCTGIAKERYSNIQKYDSIVSELSALSGVNNETEMVLTNAMAYSAMMHMDYVRSAELYNVVIQEAECEIERLVSDVGLMTLCYRVSANRHFFDYRASALSRIRRINEEYDFLSGGDRERFNRARIEFAIVSLCYFSNLAMYDDAERVLAYLKSDVESAEDSSLRLYARMIVANNEQDAMKRLTSLSVGLAAAERNNLEWLKGNYKLLLAISLRDSSLLEQFAKEHPERVAMLLPENGAIAELPSMLAKGAASDFEQYGDEYMMIEALSVEASCNIWLERYANALSLLSGAYDRVVDYYDRYYNIDADSFFNAVDYGEVLVTDVDGAVYHIPECLLSICREASCAYAGLGDNEASYINRDVYLELLRTTRLNKQLESRISATEGRAVRLKFVAVAVFLLLVSLFLFLFFVNRRRLRRDILFSLQRKNLLKVCRTLFSSLPHNIENKGELLDAVSRLLTENMADFSGKTQFFIAEGVCESELPNICIFDIHYINSTVCDKLTVATELPLNDDQRSLMAMLVPYVAVVIEEGLRLSGISEEREKIEEMKRASAIYLAEHKRENVLKRVSVSIVAGMRPFMDRISNELKVLAEHLSPEDSSRKLQYVSELTEKLEDLNTILERWIKTRQGELNLRIENFSLSELFAIIDKNSKLFETRGIALLVKPCENVVKADKALTLFMINTLVDNAAKFTGQGGSVVLEATEGEGYIEIAVTDSGIGMSQDDIDRILGSKVYDASLIGADNEQLKPKSKGGGFGLMNCKGIIEKYRKTDPLFSVCSFDISSKKGKGSRFSFRLPKGIIRLMAVLLAFLPLQMFATDDIFGKLNEYADSVFMCNVNGNHGDAVVVAQDALDLLNSYYRENVGGCDTLSLLSGNAAELMWWRDSFYPDSLKEQIYYNILDIRNEVAVASLALKNWGAYRYNNFIYSTLYRLVDEDKGVADRYDTIRQTAGNYEAAIALSCFVILLLLVYYLITLVRHNIIGKTNERLVLDMNERLLKVATRNGRYTINELAQSIADELYCCMGETMRMKGVALQLNAGNGSERVLVVASGSTGFDWDCNRLESALERGGNIVYHSGLERVIPLYAVNNGERLPVGVLSVVTERPLSESEAVSLELVSNYLASVAYHSVVRVALGYKALEELEEEAERMSYEENRMHVQNMVMDNCLSVIKHETVYYPSRIRELAVQAQNTVPDCCSAVSDMRELMDYYSSVFGILSNCALRELDGAGFSLANVRLSLFFDRAKRYAERMARKKGLDITLVCEESDAVVMVDSDLVDYLFEQLLSAALDVKKNGTLLLRAMDSDDAVKVELVDSRYEMASGEIADLFTPTRRNVNDAGGVDAMEYLVAKEIVRIHEDYTGKYGGRMEVRSDVSGTVILFTLPK